ncbi:MAG: outer membrane protein assembly factor BamB family protein, partial [Planctomycetota bacterium]
MNLLRILASIVVVSFCLSSVGSATEIDYALEDVGAGQWVCHYTVNNNTAADPIQQFIIWFEPGLYENLSIVSEPEIGEDWYQDTVEPDPIWLYYGAYRALAWDQGISVGECKTGFAVRFDYLGPGAPEPQEFDIVDPVEFVSLEAGWTKARLWVNAAVAGNPIQDGSVVYPFETIQQAIDAAVDGYTINVLPGFYEESIDFLGKAITVKSHNATMANPAVISGSGNNAVKFRNGEASDSIIEGFVITSSSGGRGIVCIFNSSPTIRNNVIVGCGFDGTRGGSAIFADVGCHPLILFNTITGNYGGYFNSGDRLGAVSIHSKDVNFEGLISHCIISGNQTNDLLVFGLGFLEPGRIRYSNIDDINGNTDWLEGAEVDEYGNFNAPPKFINESSGSGAYEVNCHLGSNSSCIDAGDPCYVSWEGQTDFDGQGRIIFGRVDVGADEVAPYTKITKPSGGEVWASDSKHEIRWESFAVDNVDIYYSRNNGADWEMFEGDLSNTGSYDWVLPAVDSDECIIWIASSVEPDDIEYTVSGVFTIHPSVQGPDVESAWATLGKNSARSGLSSEAGPEVGCVKWQFETQGSLYNSVAVGAHGRVHIASEDGKLYTIDPNDGTAVWVFDANSPMTSSPSVGADGTVYVGCMNGRLYAIDKDGGVRWTYDTGSFIYSTPAVASGEDGEVYFGSQDGKLYALGTDGSELWNFAIEGPGQVRGAILASPVIGLDNNVYIAGAYDSNLYALDPNEGTPRWVHDFRELVDANDFEG